ncbi:5-hydroxytryptamine receptor 2C isoform X2 [Balearica regulorum gibbericeps]|uniref:5-hydroxytryptamine receptor 2C isoform X2 n=1 Tax=Balearica regulorum gibbericeps TaxID=100784 RepID=UPI003F63F3A8
MGTGELDQTSAQPDLGLAWHQRPLLQGEKQEAYCRSPGVSESPPCSAVSPRTRCASSCKELPSLSAGALFQEKKWWTWKPAGDCKVSFPLRLLVSGHLLSHSRKLEELHTSFYYAWPLPKQLCPIWISLDVLFSTASIMHLCAISLDRYVAIRNPIEHSRFNSRTKAIMKIAAVWTISIGISMPIPVIGLQDDSRVFVNGTCVLNDENFVLIGSFMAFFIPLIIMVITYCLTVQVLQRQATVFMCGEVPKQRRSSVNCLKKENNTENISMLHNHEGASHLNSPVNKEAVLFRKGTMQSINNERRASKVLGIVFFLFLIMWCPFFITNVMSVLCKEACDKDLLSELLDVFVWVGYVCSGINPLVYTLFNKTYRRAFSNYIRCQYKTSKKSALRQNQCLNVASTALYGKDLTLTSYRNGNELNSMELDEEGLEMQPGTSELSINSCNVVSERVSCV